jgi:hypothetical protein
VVLTMHRGQSRTTDQNPRTVNRDAPCACAATATPCSYRIPPSLPGPDQQKSAHRPPPRLITVCHGTAPIPGPNHAQPTQCHQRPAGIAQARATGCLDACAHANAIVLAPSAAGRAAGGRPVRRGLVNDPAAVQGITALVRAGGPGLADPPGILDLYAFTPPRRLRQTMDG